VKLTNIKFAIDLLALAFVTFLAFWVRLESGWTDYLTETYVFLLLGLPVKATLIWRLGLHRRSWSKSGIRDLYALAQAMGIMLVVLALAAFFVPEVRIPRSIPLIEAGLGLLILGMIRLTTRMYFERTIRRESDQKKRPRRVLIAGAGEAGTMLAREMVRRPDTALIPVGYLDDDLTKRKKQFYGVPVLGTIDDMATVARAQRAEEVLIAMPSEDAEVIRRVLDRANEAELPHRAIPGIYDILNGSVNISQLREVALEDLLGRKPVNLNTDEIAEYVTGKTVLVTGAGGSIGSEIVRQVCRFSPDRIVLLGRGENSIFHIDGELARDWPAISAQPSSRTSGMPTRSRTSSLASIRRSSSTPPRTSTCR
jgi:FlaA1/EpsC-like NDP-sugar epimerase